MPIHALSVANVVIRCVRLHQAYQPGTQGLSGRATVDVDLVTGGWWQRLVFPNGRPEGTVDRNAYVFCVLELFLLCGPGTPERVASRKLG